MLAKTKEYAGFGRFAADSGGMAMRLPEHTEDTKDWVPADAYNLAHEFRTKHGNDLTPDLINQLLSDLNSLWHTREKKQLTRLKLAHKEEQMKLKRQLTSRVPFDAQQAKKKISRLTAELTVCRQEVAKTRQSKEQGKKAPIGVELIDNSLKIITEMQQAKNVLQKENEELRRRVEQISGMQEEATAEKRKFMEGAIWMGKKMTAEVESVCQSFEFLLIEYKQRVAAGDDAAEWLSEAVKQAGFDLYEKTINILEGAIFHKDEAAGKLGFDNMTF